MKFGKYLEREQRLEWSGKYIDYKGLKKIVAQVVENQLESANNDQQQHRQQDAIFNAGPEANVTSTSSSSGGGNNGSNRRQSSSSSVDEVEFFYALDREVEKVNAFYLYKSTELDRRFNILKDKLALIQQISSCPDKHQLESMLSAIQSLEDNVNLLLEYTHVNREGFRKILKKYDKKTGSSIQDDVMASKIDIQPFVIYSTLTDIVSSIEQIRSSLLQCSNVELKVEDDQNVILDQAVAALQSNDTAALDAILGNVVQEGNNISNLNVFFKIVMIACQIKAIDQIKFICGKYDQLLQHFDSVKEQNFIHHYVQRQGDFGQIMKDLTLADSDLSTTSADKDSDQVLRVLLSSTKDLKSLLMKQDYDGKLPLHYCALNNSKLIMKVLLEFYLPFWSELEQIWYDNDGFTPIIYAVIKGHSEVVQELLVIKKINLNIHQLAVMDNEQLNVLSHRLNHMPLLLYAAKYGHAEVIKLLLDHGADVQVCNEDGQNVCHMVSRQGNISCINVLMSKEQQHRVSDTMREQLYDKVDLVNGWTPLFYAVTEGHLKFTEILLADVKVNCLSLDSNGWSCYEHAIFRGYWDIAKLIKAFSLSSSLKNMDIASTESSPSFRFSPKMARPNGGNGTGGGGGGNSKDKGSRVYGHQTIANQCLLAVSLGWNDIKANVMPVKLNDSSIPTQSVLSLVVHGENLVGEKSYVDLPVKNPSEPIIFHTTPGQDSVKNVVLRFDIMPTFGLNSKKIIGRAVAILSDPGDDVKVGSYNGAVIRVNAPIMNSQLAIIGRIKFEYVVIKPFQHPKASIGSKQTYWKSVSTKIIGHRGAGANQSGRSGSLQVGENTVLSFITAASLGAEYVEFDVQVTKDLVPVIYHDFILSETGLNVAVNSVTLNEFQTLGPQRQQKPKSNNNRRTRNTSFDDSNFTSNNQRRSQQDQEETDQFSDNVATMSDDQNLKRMLTIQEKNMSEGVLQALNHWHMQSNGGASGDANPKIQKVRHHGGRSDNAIQAPFATLQDAFKMVPANIGFNIEVKYPTEQEAEQFGFKGSDLNVFVDQILHCVFDYAGSRPILFSSFHPEACLMLNMKQSNYPVFFLTDSGSTLTYDYRCNSLQEAVRFAKFADLLGIVTVSDPLVEAPNLCKVVKQNGLLLFSFGRLNNQVENFDLQRRYGVDAVIVDKILPIVNMSKYANSATNNNNNSSVTSTHNNNGSSNESPQSMK
ncbi:hypothetical protein MIR68_004553 [Amoeboaphelidium protococcarum]|nr:hypothetical protein MIR68_004553 [Amoeboaphelidium protococcarum]